ncbi:MAG TPA: aldo/keto reductase [Vicinamibacterales bacterium]|nr:aldo/keto reductase [Vicinamibacterales bacterium]
MELRRLGASDLVISRIGLGTWAIGGGDWVLGWGPQDVRQSIATVRRAVELGINWIDTAAVFGLGHAETVIARALRAIPRNERPLLFARGSLVWDDLGNVSHDLRRASIRAQAEASLRRLDTDAIDLYQLGWPVWPAAPSGSEPGSLEEAWETMADLQREGKVRFIGISKCGAEHLTSLQAIAPVTSLTVPYSLLRREMEDRARGACLTNGMGVVACSTLGSGLLTGTMTASRAASLPCNDWRRRHPFFHEIALTRAATYVERLRTVAARHACPTAAVAVAWALRHPAVTGAVVGARRAEQLDEIVQGASIQLVATDMAELSHGHQIQPAVRQAV